MGISSCLCRDAITCNGPRDVKWQLETQLTLFESLIPDYPTYQLEHYVASKIWVSDMGISSCLCRDAISFNPKRRQVTAWNSADTVWIFDSRLSDLPIGTNTMLPVKYGYRTWVYQVVFVEMPSPATAQETSSDSLKLSWHCLNFWFPTPIIWLTNWNTLLPDICTQVFSS